MVFVRGPNKFQAAICIMRVAISSSAFVQDHVTETLSLFAKISPSYVDEFIGIAGRGDWRSLRCSEDLADRAGLEFQKLELK